MLQELSRIRDLVCEEFIGPCAMLYMSDFDGAHKASILQSGRAPDGQSGSDLNVTFLVSPCRLSQILHTCPAYTS